MKNIWVRQKVRYRWKKNDFVHLIIQQMNYWNTKKAVCSIFDLEIVRKSTWWFRNTVDRWNLRLFIYIAPCQTPLFFHSNHCFGIWQIPFLVLSTIFLHCSFLMFHDPPCFHPSDQFVQNNIKCPLIDSPIVNHDSIAGHSNFASITLYGSPFLQ